MSEVAYQLFIRDKNGFHKYVCTFGEKRTAEEMYWDLKHAFPNRQYKIEEVTTTRVIQYETLTIQEEQF